MAMTPRFRCWPKAERSPDDCGPRFAMIDRSPDRHRRQHCSFTHRIEPLNTKQHLAEYSRILQADAYAGFNVRYLPGRKPGAIIEAGCRVGGDVAAPTPHRPGRAD